MCVHVTNVLLQLKRGIALVNLRHVLCCLSKETKAEA